MARIKVSTVIDAPLESVWAEVSVLERHVDWMADAEEIRFTSSARTGVGTAFDCVTKVGPIRLTDAMVVTSWRERREIGVTHRGVVTGVGRFALAKARNDRTRFTWTEHLTYPWWLGGPIGGFVGGFVLRRIWNRNLQTLKAAVERDRSQNG